MILPPSFNKYWVEKEQWKEEIGGTLAYLNVCNSCGEDSMYSAVVAYQILSSEKQSTCDFIGNPKYWLWYSKTSYKVAHGVCLTAK